MPIPAIYKIKAAINYIRFSLCDHPLDCFIKKTLFGKGISCLSDSIGTTYKRLD